MISALAYPLLNQSLSLASRLPKPSVKRHEPASSHFLITHTHSYVSSSFFHACLATPRTHVHFQAAGLSVKPRASAAGGQCWWGEFSVKCASCLQLVWFLFPTGAISRLHLSPQGPHTLTKPLWSNVHNIIFII